MTPNPFAWTFRAQYFTGFLVCALLLLWAVRYSMPSPRFVELVHLCVQIIVSAAILCWSWSRIRVEMGAHSELMGALDTMPVALVSLRGEIQHWSKGCERLYHYSAEQARGRIKHQLLGIDVPGRWAGMVGRLRAGLPCEEEIFEQRRDGVPLVVLEQARIIHRTTDREPVILLSMTDITALDFLQKVVRTADAIGWQAGVGGMETAGALISYLGRFPEKLPAFMADDFSVISDLPTDWLTQGCLTWHARDGRLISPEWARRAMLIKDLEKGRAQS